MYLATVFDYEYAWLPEFIGSSLYLLYYVLFLYWIYVYAATVKTTLALLFAARMKVLYGVSQVYKQEVYDC